MMNKLDELKELVDEILKHNRNYYELDNPTISVAVIVEQGGFGASSAVPIGRQIMETAFALQNVPKTKSAQ